MKPGMMLWRWYEAKRKKVIIIREDNLGRDESAFVQLLLQFFAANHDVLVGLSDIHSSGE